MSGRARSWAVAGVGAAAAAASWLLLPSPHRESAALAFAAGGAMAALVLGPEGVPAGASRAASAGAASSARDLAEALALAHPPVVVPASGNLRAERLFLPSTGPERPLPVLDDDTRLYVGPPGARFGVAVEPPGLALVLHEERGVGTPLSGAGEAEAEAFLRGLGARTLLYRGVEVRPAGEGAREVRLAPGEAAPCVADPDRRACAGGACPACSAACVALVRALGRPLLVESAREESGVTVLLLREVAS